MDNYQKLVKELSDQAIRRHNRRSFAQYLRDNWIAIVALIISIIALIKP